MSEPDGSQLGDLVATGRTAEVFALGDDHVVKLLRPGFDAGSLATEARLAAAAADAGIHTPAVLNGVEFDGRPGIVFERVSGDLLVDDIAIEPMRLKHWAGLFADAHLDVLSHESPQLPPVTDRLHAKVDDAGLDAHTTALIHGQIDVLSGGDAVLHGDFHPANAILDEDGAVWSIDWVDAARGAPAADIARTAWLLSAATVSEGVAQRRIAVAMQGSFRRAYLRRVTRALGISKRELAAWRLPVVAARLSEDVQAEDEVLRAEVARLAARM